MIGGDVQSGVVAQGGGGYGPPPGGYGMPPGGMPPGGMPPGGMPPGGAPPGGMPPGGQGMPPGGQYGAPMAPPGGGPMPGGPPGAGGNEELKKQTKTWLIISIVSMVVCCNLCFGLIGAIFCYMASSAVDQGNIADAQSKLKWGKIITIVGIVLGLIGGLVNGVLQALQYM